MNRYSVLLSIGCISGALFCNVQSVRRSHADELCSLTSSAVELAKDRNEQYRESAPPLPIAGEMWRGITDAHNVATATISPLEYLAILRVLPECCPFISLRDHGLEAAETAVAGRDYDCWVIMRFDYGKYQKECPARVLDDSPVTLGRKISITTLREDTMMNADPTVEVLVRTISRRDGARVCDCETYIYRFDTITDQFVQLWPEKGNQ